MPLENYLDESFGLSAEILAADLGSESVILDSDFGQFGNLKYESEQPSPVQLDDVLLLPDVADSLGQEWMETVDLKSLLNNLGDGQSFLGSTYQPAVQVNVTPTAPISKLVADSEPRREGLTVSTYEKLKALLTGPSQESEIIDLGIPYTPMSPQSPEALVPNLTFTAPSFESLLEETTENVLEDLIQLPSTDISGDRVIPVQSNVDLVELLSPVTDLSQSFNNSDSDFTSGPSSPAESFTLETVDLAQLDDLSTVSDKGSQISGHEFTKLKSKSKNECVRSYPYEVDVSHSHNKKDRKKVQNKNAATRYRVKKRQEKESLQSQENRMSNKNKTLKEKVESLQREISYMKELMNEIYKAKKSKI